MREDRDKAQSVANTSESLLKAERAAQERLVQQLKQLETEHLALKGDLSFFERMFPPSGSDKLAVRALQAESRAPGQLRYQMLVMQNGKALSRVQWPLRVDARGDRGWETLEPADARWRQAAAAEAICPRRGHAGVPGRSGGQDRCRSR